MRGAAGRGLAAVLLIAASALAQPADAEAQARIVRFAAPAAATPATRPALRPLRVAKWSTLVGSLGSAALGIASFRTADERYDRIERICEREPERCGRPASDEAGRYADDELQALHREATRLDDRAALALAVAQVGIAASVVFFLLDLREGDAPPNILYDPETVRWLPRPGPGAALVVTLR